MQTDITNYKPYSELTAEEKRVIGIEFGAKCEFTYSEGEITFNKTYAEFAISMAVQIGEFENYQQAVNSGIDFDAEYWEYYSMDYDALETESGIFFETNWN